MLVGGRLITGVSVMTSFSSKLEVVMHRRSDSSNYDVSGLTERMIFENMADLGPEKLFLAPRCFTVGAAIFIFMYRLDGEEYKITLTQLRVQGSTRSSLHPSAQPFWKTPE